MSSSLLTDAELSEMRDFVEDAVMPSTCTIQVPVEANTKGSVVTTFTSTYTSVPCRIMPVGQSGRNARQYVTGEKVTKTAEYIGTFPFDQAILARYRVVVDGDTYEVLGVWDDHNYRTARRADLVKVS